MIPDIFSFRKEPNVKKIVILAALIIIIIVTIFFIIGHLNKSDTNKPAVNANSSKIYYDKDETISITLDKDLNKKYKFKQYTPMNDYLIELRSENNIGVFISKKDLIEDKELSKVVDADCKSYAEQFSNSTNATTPQKFDTALTPDAYTYSLQYLEKSNNTPYYLQVTWLQFDNCYYVVDIEMPNSILQETPEEASNVLMDILSNISIIK